MYYLYILECTDGTLYTGIAVNVEKRFQEHMLGKGAKYTRSHPPAKVLYIEEHPDRSTAQKREAAVKTLSRKEKLTLIGALSIKT